MLKMCRKNVDLLRTYFPSIFINFANYLKGKFSYICSNLIINWWLESICFQ